MGVTKAGATKAKQNSRQRMSLLRLPTKTQSLAGTPKRISIGQATPELLTSTGKQPFLKKRFCGLLTKYIQHAESIKYLDSKVNKRGKKCYWCGDYT